MTHSNPFFFTTTLKNEKKVYSRRLKAYIRNLLVQTVYDFNYNRSITFNYYRHKWPDTDTSTKGGDNGGVVFLQTIYFKTWMCIV